MSIPSRVLASLLVLVAWPVLGLVTLGVDVFRAVGTRSSPAARAPKRWIATRLLVFLGVYLLDEMIGIAGLAAVWLLAGVGPSRDARLLDGTYAMQGLWTAILYGGVRRIFDLRFELEGDEHATRGPVLVFMRHTSIVDTLLPSRYLAASHGFRLRFVLKRELLADPCLDIAGLRLPNAFVTRDGTAGDADIGRVKALAERLAPTDAVIIYPEGTRFSPAKRARAIEKAEKTALDPAASAPLRVFENVLPPKLGGTLALLDACDADVLFLGHVGLEGFAEVADIFRGAMVGRTVRMKLWRVARADIPTDATGRAAWLMGEWTKLDAWIESVERVGSTASASSASDAAGVSRR